MNKILDTESELKIIGNLKYANEKLQNMLNDKSLKGNYACLPIAAVKFKIDGVFEAISSLEEAKPVHADCNEEVVEVVKRSRKKKECNEVINE